ncbi:hypothetical protein E2C01_034166 [Portunus trituberculatus]|uniref:Uncharacterized protein n=1 Tax=Portunus trituberculatus TaxID=210409 RepID=A0A5B7F7T0_PORTR|nr:hypothetical protein [Portunus trituberculatus]
MPFPLGSKKITERKVYWPEVLVLSAQGRFLGRTLNHVHWRVAAADPRLTSITRRPEHPSTLLRRQTD